MKQGLVEFYLETRFFSEVVFEDYDADIHR